MKRSAVDCLVIALVCVVTSGLGGCVPARPGMVTARGVPIVPSGTIAVGDLAGRLGLTIRKSSEYGVTLGDRFNSVAFFVDPGGVVYVNGSQVGPKGGIASVGGVIFAPAALERDIRQAMRSTVQYAPTPVPPQVKPTYTAPPAPATRYGPVVLDAGHGGKDPGAGHNGLREKDIVLAVTLLAADMLKTSGVDVRLTRSTDTFVELNDRAAMAGQVGAKLFVSVHCDAAANRGARGFTIYAPETRMTQTSGLATTMEKSMRTTHPTSRGIRAAGYRVLLRTSCPAILLELGYLTNRYDARLLASKSHQRTVARAVARAVTDYLTR